ncbi:IclR family transcriptional regulator [Actinomadura viridis]|uniref:DNA-binding IclR family transcriptional regulator n=1 Tax=Actinomadura viridis TaxID=58110 RepID=A0A931DR73_9ACTN|nr:IclR family transcriptional regulator [Actinomadura viridis]MBG6092487.1 DNA-binding IclR family transcriptional regulator [Actinomadura viridis]
MATRTARDNGDGTETAPTIQTVQRAALILDSFTVSRPHLSLNEITTRLGASKATAHRYTKALRAANLLRYDERTALYSLGPQVLTLAAAARAALPIVAAAEPYMDRLVKAVGQTVVLSIWDGEAPTVVRSADNTDHLIRISVRVGSRLDLTASAQGRVFCSYLPADQVPGLARLMRRTPDLREECDRIREHGLSVNSPAENGVHTIAAPVFEGDAIIAAMAIVGTTVSVSREADSPMALALLETTRELSQRLGNTHAPQGADAS